MHPARTMPWHVKQTHTDKNVSELTVNVRTTADLNSQFHVVLDAGTAMRVAKSSFVTIRRRCTVHTTLQSLLFATLPLDMHHP